MSFASVLHSAWLKIRTLRSLVAGLGAVALVTAAFSAPAGLDTSGGADFDPLFSAFFGVGSGQIAMITFGARAVSSEFGGGALRTSLAAVPRPGRWFAAKTVAIGASALAVGLRTGCASPAAGRTALGDRAGGTSRGEGLRAVVGCGVHLALTALFAAGPAALLRSGAATLSILVPFLLLVSFVVGDVSGNAAGLLPDGAGQVVLHRTWDGVPGPWSGLAVTAVWTSAALVAGTWSIRRRDA